MFPDLYSGQKHVVALAKFSKGQIGIMLAMLCPCSTNLWRLLEMTRVEVFQDQTDRDSSKARERPEEAFLIQIQDQEHPIHSQGSFHVQEHLLQRHVVQRGNRDDAIKVVGRKLPRQRISHAKRDIRILP